MSLIDSVQQQLGPSEINQISQRLGISPGVAQTAIGAALPMILGGLARHASQPDGANSVAQAIDAHRDAAVDPSSAIAAAQPADVTTGGGLLGRIFGQHRDTVTDGVQQTSGLDSEKAKKLLVMLSPILLGVLARRHFGETAATDVTPAALGGALQQEARTAAQQAPHVGGLLGNLINAVEGPRA